MGVPQLSIRRNAPDPAVVATLEELLTMARSGELRWITVMYGLGTACGDKAAGALTIPEQLMALELLKLDLLGVRGTGFKK